MEVLFIYFPSPNTQMGGNFILVRHAFNTIIDSGSHMGYRELYGTRWKLTADMTAFTVLIFYVRGQ
jgi:hypothetical protein